MGGCEKYEVDEVFRDASMKERRVSGTLLSPTRFAGKYIKLLISCSVYICIDDTCNVKPLSGFNE